MYNIANILSLYFVKTHYRGIRPKYLLRYFRKYKGPITFISILKNVLKRCLVYEFQFDFVIINWISW